MLMNTPDKCGGCRKCGGSIQVGERISWANGPYHIECSPLAEDIATAHGEEVEAKRKVDRAREERAKTIRKDVRETLIAQCVAIVVLFFVLLTIDTPGYYVLLRFVICGICAYLAVTTFQRGKLNWVWTFGGLWAHYLMRLKEAGASRDGPA